MPLYKSWVPKWLIHFCNFFLVIIFSNALLMNIVGYDMNQVQGHFGATAQELQLSIMLPFAILIVFAPIVMGLTFSLRLHPLFISSGLATAFCYMGCLLAPTISWFIFFKTLLCIVGFCALLCSAIPLLVTYNPKSNMAMQF